MRPCEWNATYRASPASQHCSRLPENVLWKDSLNKISKAEVYSDCTDELLTPGTQEFKFVLSPPPPVSATSEGETSECQPWVTLSAFPKNSSWQEPCQLAQDNVF